MSIDLKPFESARIKQLADSCSRKIRAGQVIPSLESVVKELVENSLDAGATRIDVKFMNNGLKSIEIIDNGRGIHSADFSIVAAPSSTSKISDHSDIRLLNSYGFRGEALHSISLMCASLIIITKHSEDRIGSKITITNGLKNEKIEPLARERGTTIKVSEIFNNVPVREGELKANLRREFQKVIQILHAFSIISYHCKFTVSNAGSDNNSKNSSHLLTSEISPNLRGSIGHVMGAHISSQLIQVIKNVDSLPSDFEGSENLDEESLNFLRSISFEGYISSLSGERSNNSSSSSNSQFTKATKEFQFLYISGRICHGGKIIRALNDLYQSRSGGLQRYPIIVLSINPPQNCVDINVSTNKKEFYIQKEPILIEMIRHLFDSALGQTIMLTQSFVSEPTLIRFSQNESSDRPKFNSSNSNDFHVVSNSSPLAHSIENEDSLTDCESKSSNKKTNVYKHISSDENKSSLDMNNEMTFVSPKSFLLSKRQNLCSDFLAQATSTPKKHHKASPPHSEDFDENLEVILNSRVVQPIHEIFRCLPINSTVRSLPQNSQLPSFSIDELQHIFEKCTENLSSENNVKDFIIQRESFLNMTVCGQFNRGFIIASLEKNLFIIDQHAADEKFRYETLCNEFPITSQNLITPVVIKLSHVAIQIMREYQHWFMECGFKFRFLSLNMESFTTDNEAAFDSMPSLDGEPLFTPDEIVEFMEKLSESSDHLSLLDCDNNSSHSKISHEYSENSFEAESSPSYEQKKHINRYFQLWKINPNKIRLVFATKACRSAVMIGQELSHSQMSQIVTNLSKLHHPWNCPHGRPTIRHLFSMF